MSELKRVLMERDGISESEADSLIQEASSAFYEYLDNGDLMEAEDVLSDFFGLEPDYIMDIM